MLEKEFQYFLDHQDELVREHRGKFVVIKGETVIGVFESKEEAYFETRKSHEVGTFLIQQALPGEDAYTRTFRSRVLA